ncbi:hypothetical protein OUZ56_029896 [Daphnia magna]|uniref:Uncharacterized protein n=1 Tax=Daphnia magna TaxID=35525 RepID=A0ABR0B869_9CRUS|nr:hypothetical protein OUZ56_029896 [Daphnia magna]
MKGYRPICLLRKLARMTICSEKLPDPIMTITSNGKTLFCIAKIVLLSRGVGVVVAILVIQISEYKEIQNRSLWPT